MSETMESEPGRSLMHRMLHKTRPQGAQDGLIKEYGLNYIGIHNMIYIP